MTNVLSSAVWCKINKFQNVFQCLIPKRDFDLLKELYCIFNNHRHMYKKLKKHNFFITFIFFLLA